MSKFESLVPESSSDPFTGEGLGATAMLAAESTEASPKLALSILPTALKFDQHGVLRYRSLWQIARAARCVKLPELRNGKRGDAHRGLLVATEKIEKIIIEDTTVLVNLATRVGVQTIGKLLTHPSITVESEIFQALGPFGHLLVSRFSKNILGLFGKPSCYYGKPPAVSLEEVVRRLGSSQ